MVVRSVSSAEDVRLLQQQQLQQQQQQRREELKAQEKERERQMQVERERQVQQQQQQQAWASTSIGSGSSGGGQSKQGASILRIQQEEAMANEVRGDTRGRRMGREKCWKAESEEKSKIVGRRVIEGGARERVEGLSEGEVLEGGVGRGEQES
jgi:hypothetical protein